VLRKARPGEETILVVEDRLGAVQQLLVGQDQRHHRLDHRRGADADAGIVAALGADLGRLAVAVDRLDRGQDRLVGLNATRTTTGWPVEMPPAMPPAWLARKIGPVIARPHRIGILLAGQARRGEAVADLDALDRVDLIIAAASSLSSLA
jgi:hypothetical protein